ncbi:hypothetical protein ABT160_38970 [Streptomyces sp. NPDC001941]|uniref:hypothetical protein n=1 Tax=Streptomyces sp. NPDC001941 TaxID=3154659 RepID=UPI00331D8777
MNSRGKKFAVFIAGITAALAATLASTSAVAADLPAATSGSAAARLDDTGWS